MSSDASSTWRQKFSGLLPNVRSRGLTLAAWLFLSLGIALAERLRRTLVSRGPSTDHEAQWVMLWMLAAAVGLGVILRAVLGARDERLGAFLFWIAVACLGRGLDAWALSEPLRLQSAIVETASSTWKGLPVSALLGAWGCMALSWITFCAWRSALDVVWPSRSGADGSLDRPSGQPGLSTSIAAAAAILQGALWTLTLLGYSSGSVEL